MRHQPTFRSLLWQVIVIALLFVAAVAWAVYERQRPADVDALRISAGDLASFAAEGRLLAEQTAQGRLQHTYAEQERRFIDQKVEAERKSLDRGVTDPGLVVVARQLREAAQRISTQLRALASLSERSARREDIAR